MTEAAEMSALPFGRKVYEVEGRDACWVQFKTSGYPRKLRREWDVADYQGAYAIAISYIVDGMIWDVDGQPVKLGPALTLSALDNVEDAVVTWVFTSFRDFWLTEVTVPRPNSLRPLATTPTA